MILFFLFFFQGLSLFSSGPMSRHNLPPLYLSSDPEPSDELWVTIGFVHGDNRYRATLKLPQFCVDCCFLYPMLQRSFFSKVAFLLTRMAPEKILPEHLRQIAHLHFRGSNVLHVRSNNRAIPEENSNVIRNYF